MSSNLFCGTDVTINMQRLLFYFCGVSEIVYLAEIKKGLERRIRPNIVLREVTVMFGRSVRKNLNQLLRALAGEGLPKFSL